MVRSWLAVLALLLSASIATPADSTLQVKPGIWYDAGDADLIVIDQRQYKVYNVTSVSCVQKDNTRPMADVVKYFDTIDSWTDDLLVVSGADFRSEAHRLKELPEPCRTTHDPNDPFYNFDAFWQYFKELYPSFALRQIDWDAMRSTYRGRIKPEMSEKELFAVMGEMIEKINDPHSFISNGKHGADEIAYGSPAAHGVAATVQLMNPDWTTDQCRDAAAKIVPALETEIRYDLLHGKFHTAHNDRLTWGMITPEVGYLRSSLNYGLFPGLKREQMYAQFEATLDRIFTDLKPAKALVIDVTTNTGGADFVAYGIAQRVIQAPVVAYQGRLKTATGLGRPFTKSLQPSPRARFSGPVILLISQNTVSAGEALPKALHGLPYVTMFGESTLGATGSILLVRLPNGGQVGVSYGVYTDRNGEWFEKRGFPPDVRAVVFDPQGPVTGYRDFVNAAVKLARSKVR